MNIVSLMLAQVAASAISSAISRKISWNICRVMATSVIWKATLRPRLTTMAPILISFYFRLDSDQSLIVSGVAATCGSPASLWAATAIFMLPLARARADNLTPGTGRLAADNPTIVALFCVQARKIAIKIRMTAVTAMASSRHLGTIASVIA